MAGSKVVVGCAVIVLDVSCEDKDGVGAVEVSMTRLGSAAVSRRVS